MRILWALTVMMKTTITISKMHLLRPTLGGDHQWAAWLHPWLKQAAAAAAVVVIGGCALDVAPSFKLLRRPRHQSTSLDQTTAAAAAAVARGQEFPKGRPQQKQPPRPPPPRRKVWPKIRWVYRSSTWLRWSRCGSEREGQPTTTATAYQAAAVEGVGVWWGLRPSTSSLIA